MDGWNAIVSFWGPASFRDFYVKTTNLYSTIPCNPAWLIKRFAIDRTVDPDRPKESTGNDDICWRLLKPFKGVHHMRKKSTTDYVVKHIYIVHMEIYVPMF